jgi:hypothetical protein
MPRASAEEGTQEKRRVVSSTDAALHCAPQSNRLGWRKLRSRHARLTWKARELVVRAAGDDIRIMTRAMVGAVRGSRGGR